MSRDFPDWVNPWNAAEGRRLYAGTLPLAGMPRLAGLLAATTGEARFSASFAQDGERRPVIEMEVEADLPLVCQASLETYPERVRRKSLLGVAASAADAARLPEHYEPVLVTEGRLALAELVEDELLLGIPQVPRKPGLEAVQWQSAVAAEKEQDTGTRRPFAALGALMGGRSGSADPEASD